MTETVTLTRWVGVEANSEDEARAIVQELIDEGRIEDSGEFSESDSMTEGYTVTDATQQQHILDTLDFDEFTEDEEENLEDAEVEKC